MAFEFITDPILKEQAETEFKTAIDGIRAETSTLIQAEVDKATAGLKKSQQTLLDEKKKIQEKYKDITDPDEALRALQLISGNEEIKLLAEGKFDEVVQRRLSTITTQHEEQLKELETKYETTAMTSTKYQSMYNEMVIDNQLRSAAAKAGVLPGAMEDVLNKGRQLFAVAEDEKTVESRDTNGKLRKTEDEKILTPENWIEGLKRVSPHYWPASRSAEFMPGGFSGDDLEMQIQAAAKSGNTALFRELRAKQKKMKEGS